MVRTKKAKGSGDREETAIARLMQLQPELGEALAEIYTPEEIAEGCLMTRDEAAMLAGLHKRTEGALYAALGRNDDYRAYDVAAWLGY